MNTVPMIAPNSITGMDGLKTRPVYFLKFNNAPTPSLVVKGEQMGTSIKNKDLEISIAWSAKLMKNVQSPAVNTKVLDHREILAFKVALSKYFPPASPQRQQAAATVKWVKMPYVGNLDSADFRSEQQVTYGTTTVTAEVFDLERLKMIIPKLLDDAFWYQLGKVVAVDIFNGNNDRFKLDTGMWVNWGNTMFIKGPAPQVIGLDTFDPTSSGNNSNLNRGKVFPELRILVDVHKRHEFALACTRSVGEIMKVNLEDDSTITLKYDTPAGPGFMEVAPAMLPKLFVPFASSFDKGLADGSTILRDYLQRKVQAAGPPPPPAQARVPANGAPLPATPAKAGGRPMISNQRNAAVGPARPATVAPKVVPQSIRDRMAFLGW